MQKSKIKFAIRVRPEIYNKIKTIAKKEGFTMKGLVERLLRELLLSMKNEKA